LHGLALILAAKGRAGKRRKNNSGNGKTANLGGRVVDRNFVKALEALKRKGHYLVLHLAPGERRPPGAVLKIFDHVAVDVAEASDLSSIRAEINGFVTRNWNIDVVAGKNGCSLVFGTMHGLKESRANYTAGRAFMKELVEGKADLRLEETETETLGGLGTLRIVHEPGWRKLHEVNGWGDRRRVWIGVDAGVGARDKGRWNVSLEDTSAKEVARVTKDLQMGRPWPARRSGARHMGCM
jgi:hypothetical protein